MRGGGGGRDSALRWRQKRFVLGSGWGRGHPPPLQPATPSSSFCLLRGATAHPPLLQQQQQQSLQGGGRDGGGAPGVVPLLFGLPLLP